MNKRTKINRWKRLVIEEENGPEVQEKLARIAKNRFTVRLDDKILEEKGKKYQIPDNFDTTVPASVLS